MGRRIELSICTYGSGDFEVMIVDKATGKELTLSGNRKLSADEFEFVASIAPACVWTEYQRITPE